MEQEALQNFADKLGLVVNQFNSVDKRKTKKKYFLVLDGVSISPVLDYTNLNHFMLGFHKAKELQK